MRVFGKRRTPRCRVDGSLKFTLKNVGGRLGRQCVKCQRRIAREWRARNPGRQAAASKRYRTRLALREMSRG